MKPSLKQSFEQGLKEKLLQKKSSRVGDETILLKQFKFFDLNNSGVLSKNEFLRAIGGIGYVFQDIEIANQVFALYDTDNDGKVNYRDFVEAVFRNQTQ